MSPLPAVFTNLKANGGNECTTSNRVDRDVRPDREVISDTCIEIPIQEFIHEGEYGSIVHTKYNHRASN